MAIKIGIPKQLLDALVRARVIDANDLPRIARINIDIPAGDIAQIHVHYVGDQQLHVALDDFIRQISSSERE